MAQDGRGGDGRGASRAGLERIDTVRQGRGTAALIQTPRNYFGAHTYRRADAPDEVVHPE